MASFFSKYPKLLYGTQVVTDILARVALRENYSNKVQLYYDYDLQEGDTPEIVASKYYGDPERHWIILLMNEIVDPIFDFPLSYSNFNSYLNSKYAIQGAPLWLSGQDYALITLNPDPASYRVIISTEDIVSGIITIDKFYIDSKAYAGQYSNPRFNFPHFETTISNMIYTQSTESVSIYDYEFELNEAKRTIKILRSEYANQFEDELQKLMRLNYG